MLADLVVLPPLEVAQDEVLRGRDHVLVLEAILGDDLVEQIVGRTAPASTWQSVSQRTQQIQIITHAACGLANRGQAGLYAMLLIAHLASMMLLIESTFHPSGKPLCVALLVEDASP